MEEEDCSSCIYKFSGSSGFKFQPSEQQIFEYYLPILIHNQKLPCNHVIAKDDMYQDYSTPWELFKDDDPHWFLTPSQSSNNNQNETSDDKKTKKSVMYVFTKLKKIIIGKKNFYRKAGCGTWNQQNSYDVLNEEGQVIGFNKGLRFQVSKQEKKKIGDINIYGSWTMREYSLKPTVLMPRIDEYAICKIRKEVKVEDEKEETYGSADNNIADYNQLEDHQLLNDNMFAPQVVVESVPHQNYGAVYSDVLLHPAQGGGGGTGNNMNPQLSQLVVDVNHAQDYNQFGNENMFFSSAADIVSNQDYGEWNVYGHMLLQPAEGGESTSNMNPEPSHANHAQDYNQFGNENMYLSSAVDIISHQQYGEWNVHANKFLQPAEGGGGISSNIVCDQPQADDMRGSRLLMSVVNRLLNKYQNKQESDGLLVPNGSTDLANVVAAATPNQLEKESDNLPQRQSPRKRKNSEDSTVTKKRKKQQYLVFN